MKKLTEQDGTSLNVVSENLAAFKALFPDVFTEDGVDFEVLRQLLGDAVDEGQEKYGLNWHGKKKARQIALTPSLGTLRPCKEESVDWETTQNLFIEGDNLEVLKLLQKSYANKVKMIYIDPPYNTDGDFIYPDKYKDNLDTYLTYIGSKTEGGMIISSDVKMDRNSINSGRFHTNWLNMMYPRIKLARTLLSDEGVFFASIDDGEQASLRKLLDEIFGEENFEGHIHWRRRHNQPNDKTKMIGLVAEHILVYTKNKMHFKSVGVGKIGLTGSFSNPDNDPRGDWASKPWKVGSDQSGSTYTIETPTGVVIEGEWMGEESTYKVLLEDKRIIFPNGGNGAPRKKYFKSEREEEGQCATNWWPHSQFGHNQGGGDEATELFGEKNVFSNPKPTKLLDNLMAIANCHDNDIVLDFFSGSCSTAQAAMTFESELQFIMVQLPEVLSEDNKDQEVAFRFCKAHHLPTNIAEIGKERIRRAAAKIKAENPGYTGDLGFKVFKLDSSNILAWNPDRNDMAQTLLDHTEHLVPGRSEEDVLYELLLKRGVDLTVPIEEKRIKGKTVYSIGYGVLFACLDPSISRDEVEELAQGIIAWHKALAPSGDTQVVFRDSAFVDDIAKTNMTAILEQNGITHVRSL